MFSQNEKNLRILGYALALFTNIVGVILFYVIVNSEKYSEDLKLESKQLLNNYVSFIIYYIIAGILCIVLIGVLILPILAILQVVFMIIGLIKSVNNEAFKIPMTIEIVK